MTTFLRCERCGNIITYLQTSGVIPQCCGEPMKQLIPGITDGKVECHLPDVKENSRELCVRVGKQDHPMTPEHRIEWIILETTDGFRVHFLTPADEPAACFGMGRGEKPVAVYAYCSLHGLWRTEV